MCYYDEGSMQALRLGRWRDPGETMPPPRHTTPGYRVFDLLWQGVRSLFHTHPSRGSTPPQPRPDRRGRRSDPSRHHADNTAL